MSHVLRLHPLKETLTHIDFKRVSMDQKIHLPLSVTHTGTPEGVKLQGGVFEVVLHQVNIECLPADLDSIADLPRIAEALEAAGYRQAQIEAMLGRRVAPLPKGRPRRSRGA